MLFKTRIMKTVELQFGEFQFYPEVIIGKIKEGIHFDMAKNKELVQVATDYYGTEMPVSYISIRENDYSIDPLVHTRNSKFKNLCGIAIVEKRVQGNSTANLESKFFKPGKLIAFQDIEDAIVWSNKETSEKLTLVRAGLSLN
ncbi:hypothetical protein FNJ87_11185 [Nonlabens mediterrranea]|uniref:STAS/SEC14 domain-containing protein n=1 Tax=Nonlabens mediterrranea TaxID=1419947 RepID=A0ABS0A6A4_9FLAO|nr:hypothetical protein [Nonlabens mediterrranea]